MKRIFVVSMVILLLVALVSTSCTKPAPATTTPAATPTTAPAVVPTTAAWVPPVPGMKQGEENLKFEWLLALHRPREVGPAPYETPTQEYLFNELEKRTGGRFKVKYAYAGTAGQLLDLPSLVGRGVDDMASVPLTAAPAEFAFLTISNNAGWYTGDPKIDDQLREYTFSHPLALANLDKMNLVNSASTLSGEFLLLLSKRTKKIETADGLRGLQLGTGKNSEMVWGKQLGMVPVTVYGVDMYESLSKGMCDVAVYSVQSVVTAKLDEVISSIIDINVGSLASMIIVNKDKWNSLPQYIKDLWREIVPTYYVEYSRQATKAKDDAGRAMCKTKGIEIYKLASAEETKLIAALTPVWADWVKEQEGYAAGKSVRQYLKDQIALRDKLTGKPWTLFTP